MPSTLLKGRSMSAFEHGTSPAGSLETELQELQRELVLERRKSATLENELRQAKEHNLTIQKVVEQEEEYITNKLIKRLEQLKKEKHALATEVEQEEEFLTNTLQKRLSKVQQEKVDLENKLEAEQELIVNKLRKQLEDLRAEKQKLHVEKVRLENQLEAEQEYILNKLQKQVEKLWCEKQSLHREKSELQRQVADLAAVVRELGRDKVELETQMEIEEESIVNRLQRQLDSVLGSFRMVEHGLRKKGRDADSQVDGMQLGRWALGRSPTRSDIYPIGLHRERPLSASSTGSLPCDSSFLRACSLSGEGLPAHRSKKECGEWR